MTDQFRIGARIGDFVRRSTRKMICGYVANGVAAGLDRMHFNLRQGIKHIWNIGQAWPIELNVLARCEMAIALVPTICDHGQLAHLCAV